MRPMHPQMTAIDHALERGSLHFSHAWRGWRHQWSQTQLLRLSYEYLGARLFHSSQMGGFEIRKLLNPAPKVFLAVGYLNVAHAHSLGWPKIDEVVDIGLPPRLPDHLRGLWEGREPLCDGSRVSLGPSGLFEAFSGLRALSKVPDRLIPPEAEAEVCSALGKWLRPRLYAVGVDWLDDMPRLRGKANSVEDLLMGRSVEGHRLLSQLPAIAEMAQTTDDELWEDVIVPQLIALQLPS